MKFKVLVSVCNNFSKGLKKLERGFRQTQRAVIMGVDVNGICTTIQSVLLTNVWRENRELGEQEEGMNSRLTSSSQLVSRRRGVLEVGTD